MPHVPVTGFPDPAGALRAFAVQYRIDLDDARTTGTFRAAMRQLMDTLVVPYLADDRPNLVVFPEAIGLLAMATGPRGRGLRDAPSGDARQAPAALMGGLEGLGAAYLPQLFEYTARLGRLHPVKGLFTALTDTNARAFVDTFADIARDYGVYVVAGNYQADYIESTDPADIAALADPEAVAAAIAAGQTPVAYVATSTHVTNQTLLWGPHDTRTDGPRGLRNVCARNRKTPLTESELMLGLDAGPTGPEAARDAGYYELAGLRLGFATSLPAFQYGYPFAQRPDDLDPATDVAAHYVPFQDSLGVDVMIQADANNGPWATPVANGAWQPLEWMGSTWRAVADPSVSFRYNICPMMTGNLLDVAFDGQSSITARAGQAPPQRYVGNAPHDDDPAHYAAYAGDKSEFLALAPWVVPDAPRGDLMAVMAQLATGSGHERENDYVQTVVWADLTKGDQ